MPDDVRSAKVVLLKDIGHCKVGDSVRVAGIWSKYNADVKMAIIAYDDVNVHVDMANAEFSEHVNEGDLIMVIGEISNMALHRVTIKARIVRCENTLDMQLYQSVVKLRDEHLSLN